MPTILSDVVSVQQDFERYKETVAGLRHTCAQATFCVMLLHEELVRKLVIKNPQLIEEISKGLVSELKEKSHTVDTRI